MKTREQLEQENKELLEALKDAKHWVERLHLKSGFNQELNDDLVKINEAMNKAIG